MNAVPHPTTFDLPEGRFVCAQRIIVESASKYGIVPDDIRSGARFRPIMLARTEAAWRIASETDISLKRIGKLLSKDHTTIITAVRRENDRRSANVRGLGGVPAAKYERDRRTSREVKALATRDNEDEALRMFRAGKDTFQIAKDKRWTEAHAAKLLAGAREREHRR